MIELKEGDTVEWTSQSSGYETTKRGVIVRVVQPNQPASGIINSLLQSGGYKSNFGGGMSRGSISYIVSVDSKTGKGRKTLYWPLASKLKKK
jgi:hypothetical protein